MHVHLSVTRNTVVYVTDLTIELLKSVEPSLAALQQNNEIAEEVLVEEQKRFITDRHSILQFTGCHAKINTQLI